MIALVLALAAAASPIPPAPEKRCGWLSNPTPANYWLRDREGEWTLGEQGGYQAPGMDELPDMTAKGWVATNGSYGYGCACLSVTTDKRTKQVTRIFSGQSVPLKQCRADRRLAKP
ncbi:DUF4087 domain-containing protein [Sphingomonas panacisoli]|uniref:DUF4087 domain-containing protein n=1 Tax=Sphingomonas panacisoli TaxID=1813879 RepID=A0A5B8LED9_9SPHN|nr:DUF4087 domain-containing protein [Sphingomonas panacisoli]QDZ06497.1 DUF4087 domain-containing protein [Sphingomonas panacisoli]